jgi:hypothetical protein
MSPIVVTTEIDRPADVVFDYAADPTRFNQWQDGVVEGHLDHDGTPSVGAICTTTRRIGGKTRPSTSRLAVYDPPRSWGVRWIDGPIRGIIDVTVEPVTSTRSRLTISVDFEGHGIGTVLVPLLVRPQARKEMPGNLARLKARVEGTSAQAQ